MKVKELKKALECFNDEEEVVLLDEARIGHDDAVLDFEIVAGFGNSETCSDDVRLNLEEDEADDYPYPLVAISFWK